MKYGSLLFTSMYAWLENAGTESTVIVPDDWDEEVVVSGCVESVSLWLDNFEDAVFGWLLALVLASDPHAVSNRLKSSAIAKTAFFMGFSPFILAPYFLLAFMALKIALPTNEPTK